ncbi:hypothetical protein [Streptomyces naphthomycinicus]|uniref:hypothetical protein n=1 Tax=Streptomyces naphthomycinicus TaxID=2872625 RepID=UPI001CED5BFE|nr:hypothetical protein [Streptomyces sp. TML10]
MPDEQYRPLAAPLTALQRARIDYARQDLECARDEDLALLDPASLILIIQRLRSRLGDMLDLTDEIAGPEPKAPGR